MPNTSIPRNTMYLDYLRHDLCAKAGLSQTSLTPASFDLLETEIKKVLPQAQISAKTLRRLFGYDEVDPCSTIRRYTIDILVQYLGYGDWDAYLDSIRSSGPFVGEHIPASSLNVGDEIELTWLPNRTSVVRYLGENRFEVVSSINASWQVGDTFTCQRFIPKWTLLVDDLKDKEGNLKEHHYSVGNSGGLTTCVKRS